MALTVMNITNQDRDAQLATELAMQLAPTVDILARYGITPVDLKFKLGNPAFRHMFQEAKRVWNSELTAKERIEAKARMLVEDSLLEVYNVVHDANVGPQARVDAFKQLTKVAGVDQRDKGTDAAARVSVTFNFGGAQKPVMIEGVVLPQADGLKELPAEDDDD